MHFDRIVRTDIVADEGGVLATMRFDEEAIRDMAGKIDAELFDRIAAERGYLRQGVDVAALLRIAAKLEEDADYGSWQAETAGRIRETVEDGDVPKQVSDVPYCPTCLYDGYWRLASADAEGYEALRCAGCGRDYRYKRPGKGGDAS